MKVGGKTMGCWGAGIFDDDLAVDVRDLYDEVIKKGFSDSMAVRVITKLYESSLEVEDDNIIIYSALSSMQLNRNCLAPEIRDKTIELIDANSGMGRWVEAGRSPFKERRNELNRLKNILIKAPVNDPHAGMEEEYPDEYNSPLAYCVYQLSKAEKTYYIGSTAFPEKRLRYMNFINFEKEGFLNKLFKSSKTKEQEFWEWFSDNEDRLFESNSVSDVIVYELSSRLKKIHKGLTFEFSIIKEGKRTFAISADGIMDAFPVVIKLYNEPKLLKKWIVVPFRGRVKDIDRAAINMGDISMNVSDIFFMLIQEDTRVSLNICVKGIEDVTPQIINAIYLILDSAIGEYDVETKLGRIEVLPESVLSKKGNLKHLKELCQIIDNIK